MMAHAHDRSTARNDYFLDQICSIGACVLLGGVCVLMWTTGKVALILAPQFHLPVLIGGIALLVIAFVQLWAIWKAAGKVIAEHDHHHHEHEGPCDHDHQHIDCGHDHDHNWMPAKYALLLLPVMLFLLGLPHEGFSADALRKNMQSQQGEIQGSDREIARKGEDLSLGFKELSNAAHVEQKRLSLEGKTVRLRGMFMKLKNDKEFTLFKIRMNCCAADATPMPVRIMSPAPVNQFQDREWVEVKGQLEFRKLQGQNRFIPVVTVEEMSHIKRIPAEPTEFDFS